MTNKEIDKLKDLVMDLGWDCQSMTRSGVFYYNEICVLLDLEPYERPNDLYCDISERINYEQV